MLHAFRRRRMLNIPAQAELPQLPQLLLLLLLLLLLMLSVLSAAQCTVSAWQSI